MLMSTLAPVWCGGLVKTTRVVNMSINVAVIPPWRLPERFRWPSSIFILNEAFPSSHDRSSTYKRHRTKCISTGIPSLKWVILCTLQWRCYSTAKLYAFVCKKCFFLEFSLKFFNSKERFFYTNSSNLAIGQQWYCYFELRIAVLEYMDVHIHTMPQQPGEDRTAPSPKWNKFSQV